MAQAIRDAVAREGVDLSRRKFQRLAADRSGRSVTAKPMSPDRFFDRPAELPVDCPVAIEAFGRVHHAPRRFHLLGPGARLIGGHIVMPYRMVGSCGMNDAERRPERESLSIGLASTCGRLTLIPCESSPKSHRLLWPPFLRPPGLTLPPAKKPQQQSWR